MLTYSAKLLSVLKHCHVWFIPLPGYLASLILHLRKWFHKYDTPHFLGQNPRLYLTWVTAQADHVCRLMGYPENSHQSRLTQTILIKISLLSIFLALWESRNRSVFTDPSPTSLLLSFSVPLPAAFLSIRLIFIFIQDFCQSLNRSRSGSYYSLQLISEKRPWNHQLSHQSCSSSSSTFPRALLLCRGS